MKVGPFDMFAGVESVADMRANFKKTSSYDYVSGSHHPVVSRKEYVRMADAWAKQTQRLTYVIRMMTSEQLTAFGLLPDASEELQDDGERDAVIMRTLDEKIELFNAAHARLTGKRKHIPETGKLKLSAEEMSYTILMRSRGATTQEILQGIRDRREKG